MSGDRQRSSGAWGQIPRSLTDQHMFGWSTHDRVETNRTSRQKIVLQCQQGCRFLHLQQGEWKIAHHNLPALIRLGSPIFRLSVVSSLRTIVIVSSPPAITPRTLVISVITVTRVTYLKLNQEDQGKTWARADFSKLSPSLQPSDCSLMTHSATLCIDKVGK